MKITRSDHEKLVIIDFPYLIGGGLILLALVMFGHLLTLVARGGISNHDLIGHLLSGSFALVCSAIFMKRSVFEFDLTRHQLSWSRASLFGRKGATTPFDQIKGVTIQAMSSSGNSSLTYRVALTTTRGELPLTASYGQEGPCKKIRGAITQALGLSQLPEDQADEADLRAMVASGRITDAMALVRQRRNCTLAEAIKIVEGLKKECAGPNF